MIVLCRIIRPSGEQYDDILELALRRRGCAHSKPSRLPERLPLPHEIPQWMLDDFDKRLKEDQAQHPERYGQLRPRSKLVTSKAEVPPEY
jgi:hypothetical protein